jgi:NAD(P)H dehydrogenase (quinone)
LVAVTGATGVVGGGVARRLATAGIDQRLLVRSPGRTPALPGAQVAVASYGDAAAARDALTGVDTVFMVSGAEDPRRRADHLTFVDAAAAAGVRRVVYTSFFGAGPDSTFLLARDHWYTEQRIRDLGLHFTFLRDNLYADQFLDFAGPEGVLRGPAGDGRVAAVARADVIDVAVEVLQAAALSPASTEHDGMTYRLTGPESLNLDEVAEIITKVTGRRIRYEPETVEQAYASRAGFGAPGWQLDAWVSTYTAIATGELDGVTDDVARITGHPPISLDQLLGG